jgi:hypothetical protein
MTFEGPLIPKLADRETIVGFLTSILPLIGGIEIKQHIVYGDYVATVFDMDSINGVDNVIDLCLVVGGELKRFAPSIIQAQGPRQAIELAGAQNSDHTVCTVRWRVLPLFHRPPGSYQNGCNVPDRRHALRTSGGLVPEAEAQAHAAEAKCRDFKTAHFQFALCWRLATMGGDVLL